MDSPQQLSSLPMMPKLTPCRGKGLGHGSGDLLAAHVEAGGAADEEKILRIFGEGRDYQHLSIHAVTLIPLAGPGIALGVQAARDGPETRGDGSRFSHHGPHASDITDDVHTPGADIHAGPAGCAGKETILGFESFRSELTQPLYPTDVELLRSRSGNEPVRACARAEPALHTPVQVFTPGVYDCVS